MFRPIEFDTKPPAACSRIVQGTCKIGCWRTESWFPIIQIGHEHAARGIFALTEAGDVVRKARSIEFG